MLDLNSHNVTVCLGLQPNKGKRVLRGGSWINNGGNLRSAYRNYNHPDNRNNNIGLRLSAALCATVSQQARQKTNINQLLLLFYCMVRALHNKQTKGAVWASQYITKRPYWHRFLRFWNVKLCR